jgi:hypothetical protein
MNVGQSPGGSVLVGGAPASAANPVPVQPIVGGGAVVPGNPLSVTQFPLGQSLQANGTAAAPGAGSAIATIATPAAGTYLVRMTYQLSGTAETAVKNLRLSGATLNVDYETLGTPINNVIVDAMTMDGVASIVAKAVAAATAGSVYTVTIVATRMY